MTAAALESLAWSMRSNHTPIPVNLIQGHMPPPIAVTYFGQFIDHDLTFDSTPLREAGLCDPIHTINHRTPWLDLDHVYGDGPRSTRHHTLYESDDASFRIGDSPFGGEAFDVPFTDDGHPALVDPRDGGNPILRQMHVIFLKLHNVAVHELSTSLRSLERFDRARNRVRWQYQWLIRNWYLKEICHPQVYETVIEKGDRRIDWSQDGFAIPVEFSVAAFRFGHSMVRSRYHLNAVPPNEGGSGLVSLSDIFAASNGPLHPRLKVDWSLLSRPPHTAMSIDTAVVEPLFQLPDEHIDLHVSSPIPHSPNALVFRTLLRGAAMRLPTGQQVRDALGQGAIADTPPQYELDPWSALRTVGLAEGSPLLYYILLEAQLDCVGACLGRVGSTIVAEVIEGSLQLDPTSFLRQKGPDWKPEPWITADGRKVQINSLKDVATVASV